MCNLKVKQSIISGYVLSIRKNKKNISVVNLKTKNFADGVMMINEGIPIIVNGDIGDLQPNDPIAFMGFLVPDKYVEGAVCLMTRAEDMFVPEEW